MTVEMFTMHLNRVRSDVLYSAAYIMASATMLGISRESTTTVEPLPKPLLWGMLYITGIHEMLTFPLYMLQCLDADKRNSMCMGLCKEDCKTWGVQSI